MSTKHTPGPWTNHGRIPQLGLPHSSVAAKTLLARVYSEAFGDIEQEAANANLIAAAPELLEALKDLIGWVPMDKAAWHTNAAAKAVDRARSAIAKATGSAP